MKYPTPYQRLLRAFEKGKGVRLSADEVAQMICHDDAIKSAAENDDEDEELARSKTNSEGKSPE